MRPSATPIRRPFLSHEPQNELLGTGFGSDFYAASRRGLSGDSE